VDPGIEMVKSQDDDISALDSSTYCSVCDVYMKPRTEHCKECEVCIQEYDHHCPWTSKCIGKGNLMFFYMFLSSLFIAFIYGIFTMAAQQRLPKNL
jgi:palmitoyltransferase ZDHHC9/14/18/palmitoyltransferase